MARRSVQIRLSLEARETWYGLARRYGVSLTALMESFAEHVRERDALPASKRSWDEIGRRAVVIDADRRQR